MPSPVCAETDQNLISLSKRMERMVRLDIGLPDDVVLVGAMADRREFSLDHHGPEKMSFGGRGLQETEAAITCLGEAAEHISFYERENDPLLEPPGKLEFSTVQTRWMEKAAGGTLAHRPRVRGWRLGDGDTFLPADLVLRRPPNRRTSFRPAETTGLAAGPTLADAIEHALLEVIERDAVALWWWGGAPGRPLPTGCQRADNRNHWCLDITSDLGVPVVAALSASETDDAITIGFSAARTIEEATRTAYLELRQMETALSLSFHKLRHENPTTLHPQDRAILDRAMRLSLQDHAWLAGEDGEMAQPYAARTKDICDILSDAGFEAFCVDLTRTDIAVPVVRVLVPGLQLIKPGMVSERLERLQNAHPNARARDLPPPT